MLKGKCVWAGALAIIATVVFGANTFAESDTTDFSITVNPSLNLSVSSANGEFQLTPTKTGFYDSASFNVYSSTNNATGYTLTMSTSKVNLESDTINPTTGTEPTIPTLAETADGISAAAFEASTSSDVLNHYGISIAGANYNAMKDEKEIKKTEENNVTEDTTAISLAAKLDLLTVPGVYSTTINFQIVANSTDPVQPYPEDPCIANPDCNPESGVTLQRAYEMAYTNAHKGMYEETTPGSNTYQYIDSWNGGQYQGEGRDVRFLIQDMTPEVCATATAINSQALVLDIRDQSSYYIVKAADGRCWMQDNLALDLTNVNVKNAMYSDTDTNHNTNTNATNAQLGYLFNGGRVSGDSSTDNLPEAGLNGWTNFISRSIPLINTAHTNVVPQGIDDPLKELAYSESWKVGIYYNYCAASAGSYCYNNGYDVPDTAIDATADICPAGWRIPTGGAISSTGNNAGGGEYQALFNSYPSIDGGESQYIRVRKALRLPLSGGVDIGSSVRDQGIYGSFLSSTYYSGTHMFDLLISNSSSVPGNYFDREFGGSIRCIAK